MAPEAQWCGQCYLPRGHVASERGSVMTRPVSAPETLAPPVVRTRWRKTQTTFGPVGRVLATIALVVPFLLLVAAGILDGGMTIGGAALWGVVIMPWGLRDVWRAGALPTR
jgi:hypothetical protein